MDSPKVALTALSTNPAVVGGLAVVVIAASAYGYFQLVSLSQEVQALRSELASTSALLQDSVLQASTTLTSAFEREKQSIAVQIGGVQEQVGKVSGTVKDLEKLSATDPEFLAKYSRVFFLSENYAPARLAEIPSEYKYNERAPLQVIPEVLPFLTDLLEDAKDDGVEIFLLSAYRSFGTQEALKGQYRVTYGAGTANAFSADQGYSEHQLGTAVDFITTGTGGALEGFDQKPAYEWLLQNAHEYGFVLSYPKGNGFYVFEPWHWRFVGVKLATDLKKSGKTFYGMDQREIDAFLIYLFDEK